MRGRKGEVGLSRVGSSTFSSKITPIHMCMYIGRVGEGGMVGRARERMVRKSDVRKSPIEWKI